MTESTGSNRDRFAGVRGFLHLAFFLVVGIESVLAISGGIAGQTGQLWAGFHFFKITYVLAFIITLVLAAVQGVVLNRLTVVVLSAGLFALAIGLLRDQLGSAYVSHFYSIGIAVFGLNFGNSLYHHTSEDFLKVIGRWLTLFFLMSGSLLLLYFLLVQVGVIKYFGLSNAVQNYSAFYASAGSWGAVGLAFLFVLLSGKRSSLLGLCVQIVCVVLLSRGARGALKRLSRAGRIALFSVAGGLLVLVAWQLGLLYRFELILTSDLSTERGLYLATSGRSQEFFAVWEHLQSRPLSLFIGEGAGSLFQMPYGIDKEKIVDLQYSHFTPLSLALLYGIPVAVYLYLEMCWGLWKGRKRNPSPMYLLFASGVVLSFLGASPMTDMKFWVAFGFVFAANSSADVSKDEQWVSTVSKNALLRFFDFRQAAWRSKSAKTSF